MKPPLFSLSASFILLFGLSSCYSGEGESERYGKPAHETRNVHNYTGISVSTGIEVLLKMGTSEHVEVQAGEEIIRKVSTEVHNGILEIKLKTMGWHFGSHQNIKVYVSAIQIQTLNATAGASINGTNLLEGKNLEMDANAGASIKIQVKEEALKASSGSGAEIELTGNSANEELEASSGGSIKAGDLVSQYSTANASSGGEVHLNAQKSLTGEASSGGSITYKGKPAQVNKNKSSGGSIEEE
jgi:hypothetical protein